MPRLDQILVDRGLCESREKAKRLILAGQALINGHPANKASDKVSDDDAVSLKSTEKFVSRGGLKLEKALEHFNLEAEGVTAIDMGASTGGFTDCLLQRGASKVYAVDVGRGQLAWKLRQDGRVKVMEKTNARFLSPDSFESDFQPVDLVVIDCSFISLRKLLPVAIALLKPSGSIAALIKPQFEAGKAEADKGAGVIRDPEVHKRVIAELRSFVDSISEARWRGCTESPIHGPAGNKEFLAHIEKVC